MRGFILLLTIGVLLLAVPCMASDDCPACPLRGTCEVTTSTVTATVLGVAVVGIVGDRRPVRSIVKSIESKRPARSAVKGLVARKPGRSVIKRVLKLPRRR